MRVVFVRSYPQQSSPRNPPGQHGPIEGNTDETSEGSRLDAKNAPQGVIIASEFTIFGNDISRGGMAVAAPATVIDRVVPQPSGFGPPAAGVEHRQRGVVGEQLGRGQHRADDQLAERRQPPAGTSYPVAQGRAIQGDRTGSSGSVPRSICTS